MNINNIKIILIAYISFSILHAKDDIYKKHIYGLSPKFVMVNRAHDLPYFLMDYSIDKNGNIGAGIMTFNYFVQCYIVAGCRIGTHFVAMKVVPYQKINNYINMKTMMLRSNNFKKLDFHIYPNHDRYIVTLPSELGNEFIYDVTSTLDRFVNYVYSS